MRGLLFSSALAVLAPLAANAQTLTMGLGGNVTSLDPHYHSAGPNSAFAYTIFSRLTQTDENARLLPGLAESWEMIDPLTWEFRLRKDVTFHNGEAFTAEDVVFTFERIPQVVNSPGPYTSYLRGISGTEIIDPHTLRITTDYPVPILPLMMHNIAILDSTTHAEVTTEDFNSGRALIGTGPFRYMSGSTNSGIKLARNENFWGDTPDWETVDYRIITNGAARTAAFLAGDVDIIDQVASADVPRLSQSDQGDVVSKVALRLMYINLDHSRAENPVFLTDNDGKPLATNPIKDLRIWSPRRRTQSARANCWPRPVIPRGFGSRCMARTIGSPMMRGCCKPSGKCGPASACGPKSMPCPMGPSRPVPARRSSRLS